MLDRSSTALRDHYDALPGLARSAPVNHIDETGWRLFGPQGRIPHLLWVMTSELVTTYMISWGKKRECLPGAPRRLVWLSDIR